jgi:hypothetical protein
MGFVVLEKTIGKTEVFSGFDTKNALYLFSLFQTKFSTSASSQFTLRQVNNAAFVAEVNVFENGASGRNLYIVWVCSESKNVKFQNGYELRMKNEYTNLLKWQRPSP